MEPFEPLINLLALLSVLSIAAERLANVIKLGDPVLRTLGDARERERRIANRVILVSVALAVVIKADLFQILSHLDAPWDTLGWSGNRPAGAGGVLYAIGGSALTGISLGFGSKFWHDALDVVSALRASIREPRSLVSSPSPVRERGQG